MEPFDLKILVKNEKNQHEIIELFWVLYLHKITNVNNNTQSEIIAELLDPKLSAVFLNVWTPLQQVKKKGSLQ